MLLVERVATQCLVTRDSMHHYLRIGMFSQIKPSPVSWTSQSGQGMMEYIIIVALIAVAAIGIYSAFGKTVRTQTAGLAKELAGQKADISKAVDAANAAAGRANDPKKVGLGQYNYANDQVSSK
jgi:Flp pilus assembly pilin Flp